MRANVGESLELCIHLSPEEINSLDLKDRLKGNVKVLNRDSRPVKLIPLFVLLNKTRIPLPDDLHINWEAYPRGYILDAKVFKVTLSPDSYEELKRRRETHVR